MNKTWLIRTKNNHILGPVSKLKIGELISNGTIKGDDEVCDGNGYWFYIREQDLVSKYVLSDLKQQFNPVQEATPSKIVDIPQTEEEANNFDKNENNSIKEEPVDITLVNLKLNDISSGEDLASENEMECEQTTEESDLSEVKIADKVPAPVHVVKAGKPRTGKNNNEEIKGRGSRVSVTTLYILAIIFVALAAISFKYKKQIFSEINGHVSLSIIPTVAAQELAEVKVVKKKNG